MHKNTSLRNHLKDIQTVFHGTVPVTFISPYESFLMTKLNSKSTNGRALRYTKEDNCSIQNSTGGQLKSAEVGKTGIASFAANIIRNFAFDSGK